MKIIVAIGVVVGAIVWGLPAVSLSENAASAYLDELERLSLSGKAAEYCERMHPDLVVDVTDATSAQGGTMRIEGGRKEWCEYIDFATRGLSLLGMESRAVRDDFEVTRDWRHPWTVEVRYRERRTSTMSRVNTTLRTLSDDRWTLVQTISGVKVLRLSVNSRLAP